MLLASRKLVIGKAIKLLRDYIFCLRPSGIKNCAFIIQIQLINAEREQGSIRPDFISSSLSLLSIQLNSIIIRHNTSDCCEF